MPDCYSADDWSRSYLLPAHVVTNIPHRGSEVEPGAYHHARGMPAEICRATGANPLALHYTDTTTPNGGLTRITALAKLPNRSRVATSCGDHGDLGRGWRGTARRSAHRAGASGDEPGPSTQVRPAA